MRNKTVWLLPLLLPVLLLFVIPAPIDSLPWHPEPPPAMTGPWQPNDVLTKTTLVNKAMNGPEDVDMDKQGRIYGGQRDGKILRIDVTGKAEVFADTQGRPLGLEFDHGGNLVVADAVKGLLRISPDGHVHTLSTSADGIPFGFTDDLDISEDGIIYFSDASTRWDVHHFKRDALEMRPTGRLLAYNPATGKTTTLLSGLYFANGVALSSREDFVLVNETWKYRITRYWLKGPRAGTHDVFADNLPGFPDGISGNRQGTFWLALYSPRNPLLDRIHPYPWIKNQLARLPTFLQPKPARYGLIAALDELGHVKASWHDPTGTVVHGITSVEQAGGQLLLGTLTGQWIGKISLDHLGQRNARIQ